LWRERLKFSHDNLPITLEVSGTRYENFISATANIALDTLANDFNFDATAPGLKLLPFKGGEPCRVFVDDVLVITGFIENIAGNYSSLSHGIAVSGRDKTADLIDSSINTIDDLRGALTLKSIIERVIKHLDLKLKVIDNVRPNAFNKAEDIVSISPGSNAFSVIDEYAQKRQVILTSNDNGDIVITNSEPTKSTGSLRHKVNSDSNNILNASWSYSTVDLFNKYIQLGQQDSSALAFGGAFSLDGIVAQDATAKDNGTRKGRQLVSVASIGFSDDQLKQRAEWSKKIRRSRSTVYTASVQGFTDQAGNLWKINQLVNVIDDFADINRDLLINTLSFSYGLSGSVTTIGFVEKNAYKLISQEPKAVGKSQDAFIL